MIELDHVQKTEGANPVLDIESLAVRAGEVAAVAGAPGSGKAALLALLVGQTRPTAGRVRVAGLDPSQDRQQLGRHIGAMFADNALYARLTARANLLFHCRVRGLPPERADEVLAAVGLADHAAVPAGRLLPGLARRLDLGRAILHNPAVLLLAHPFAGCEDASAAIISGQIRQQAGAGAAVLMLVNDVAGLENLCQTVHELAQGRITRSYAPQDARRTDLPFKVPARLEGRVTLLNPTDILYVSAESGRTFLHTADGQQLPTHFTLAELDERLIRSGFFRAHRAYLVNLQRVKAVIPYTRDSFTLLLDDPAETQIPLSKTSARELRDLLGY